MDTRGAGPYGPRGELYLFMCLHYRACQLGLSFDHINKVDDCLIPELAAQLLHIDAGYPIEEAREHITAGAAFGRLIHTLSLAVLQQAARWIVPDPPKNPPTNLSANDHLQQLAEAACSRRIEDAQQNAASRTQELQDHIAASSSRIQQLQDELDTSSSAVQRLQAELVETESTVHRLQEEVSASQDELTSTKAALRGLEDTSAACQAGLSASMARERQLQEEHSKSTAKLQQLLEELATCNGNLSASTSNSNQLQDALTACQADLSASIARERQLQDELSASMARGQQVQQELATCKDNLSASTTKSNQLQEELIAFRDNRGDRHHPVECPKDVAHPSSSASPSATRKCRPVPLQGQQDIHPHVFGMKNLLIHKRDVYSWMRGPGRYKSYSRIGAGSQGSVYRAMDLLRPEPVAIKSVSGKVKESFPRTLWNEIGALTRIEHPNVIQLRDVLLVQLDGRPQMHLVLDFCETDLLQVLSSNSTRQQLTAPVVQTLMSQVARGLQAVHQAGIAHFDLKPANILIGSDGRVRIGDFGLAEDLRQPHPSTRRQAVVSLWYRSPEALLRSIDVGSFVDVCSFGVVLAQLLDPTGVPPWFTGQADEMISHIAADMGLVGRELWPGSDELPGALSDENIAYSDPRRGVIRSIALPPGVASRAPLPSRLRAMRGADNTYDELIEALPHILVVDPSRRPSMTAIVSQSVVLSGPAQGSLPRFPSRHTSER
ncbi:hypothetical protein CF326_g8978 [Tilletia indica]|nr:hypothetical protein CF326_g8978 [Tilletia indica]